MKALTEAEFYEINRAIEKHSITFIANKYDRSPKTILQIRGSLSFSQYQQQNQAQHPPTVYSLKDQVLYAHRLMFRQDNTYIPPETARQAIYDIQSKLKEK